MMVPMLLCTGKVTKVILKSVFLERCSFCFWKISMTIIAVTTGDLFVSISYYLVFLEQSFLF